MHMQFPVNTKIVLGNPRSTTVTYVMGRKAEFVVGKEVIDAIPGSFLDLQLQRRDTMASGIEEDENHNIKVHFPDYDPLLFPIVFGYLVNMHTHPIIPTHGLNDTERMDVEHLIQHFLMVEMPEITSVLYFAKDTRTFDPDRVQIKRADGRIVPLRLVARGEIDVTITTDGKLACSHGGTILQIDLRAIPTSPPWGVSKATKPFGAGKRRRADSNTYPYPVDLQRTFFIPATAIKVRLFNDDEVECEGVFDIKTDTLRVDAVDQDRYDWFGLDVRVKLI